MCVADSITLNELRAPIEILTPRTVMSSETSLSPREAERIAATVGQVPSGLQTALEIGFNDGRMTACIRDKVRTVFGIDLPSEHACGDQTGRVFGTVGHLPFRSGSADIVVCCEVLEHLDQPTYDLAVREIPRVARQYMLVTAPNRQRVQNELSRCGHCGHIGHYSSHVRAFNNKSFQGVFPDWELVTVFDLGPDHRGYAPDWMYRLKCALGVFEPRPWPCDHCGREDRPAAAERLSGKLVQFVITHVERLAPRRRPWVLFLWKRRSTLVS